MKSLLAANRYVALLRCLGGNSGADSGIFDLGAPNFDSERTVERFCGKLLLPHTTPPTSRWEGRDDHVFLNLWTPVAVGAGNTALRAEANRSCEGTQKQSHFWISLEFSLVVKCNARFIKKISQLKSDIRSCRCKIFSLKQASGLMGGGGPDPRTLPPGSATETISHILLWVET